MAVLADHAKRAWVLEEVTIALCRNGCVDRAGSCARRPSICSDFRLGAGVAG